MRDGFVFYRSFYESIKELDEEQQLKIFKAICEYEFNKKEIELEGVSKSIFTLILPQLIANDKKYENGKKGGRPKNQNETKIKPNQNQNETKLKPKEKEKEKEKDKVKDKNINNIYAQKFEQFYEAYPKKVSKANVEKWFNKNKPDDELFKKIMTSLENYKRSKQWKDKQFIPYPITWLNQKRWEDEIEIEKTTDEIWKELEEELNE